MAEGEVRREAFVKFSC